MKTLFKENKLLSFRRMYIREDLIEGNFSRFLQSFDVHDFAWRQNSECSKFARFEFEGKGYYIKKFEDRSHLEWIKTIIRGSRATRELYGNTLLLRNGILAPSTVAIINNKRGNYIVTEEIIADGSLQDYLLSSAKNLHDKRAVSAAFARKLADIHNRNIILGDVNMGNILVKVCCANVIIYVLDNERTRKRIFVTKGMIYNLVQLNKNPIKKITMTQRFHFFKIYADQRNIDLRDKYLLRLILDKTLKRRAKGTVSFRKATGGIENH